MIRKFDKLDLMFILSIIVIACVVYFTNIYYLPDYSSPFYIKKVSSYFKTLKRKLMKGKHKNFFFVIRKAEIYHEIMMKEKNLNYPSKKK